ncbi:hypothetical protein D3C71_467650 [compost metagenome]
MQQTGNRQDLQHAEAKTAHQHQVEAAERRDIDADPAKADEEKAQTGKQARKPQACDLDRPTPSADKTFCDAVEECSACRQYQVTADGIGKAWKLGGNQQTCKPRREVDPPRMRTVGRGFLTRVENTIGDRHGDASQCQAEKAKQCILHEPYSALGQIIGVRQHGKTQKAGGDCQRCEQQDEAGQRHRPFSPPQTGGVTNKENQPYLIKNAAEKDCGVNAE